MDAISGSRISTGPAGDACTVAQRLVDRLMSRLDRLITMAQPPH